MNGVYVDKQYGFRPHISTEMASYKLTDEILVPINYKISLEGGIYFVTWKRL